MRAASILFAFATYSLCALGFGTARYIIGLLALRIKVPLFQCGNHKMQLFKMCNPKKYCAMQEAESLFSMDIVNFIE